ncbi:MAG TPA: hypothetical protein PKC30_09700 [Saprospiraceae bacterium]|nr:hypothetical protein [Saprospiraceae bacterium]
MEKYDHAFYKNGHGGEIALVLPLNKRVLSYTSRLSTRGQFFDKALVLFDTFKAGCT